MTEPVSAGSRMNLNALLNPVAVSPRPRHVSKREDSVAATNQIPSFRTAFPCPETIGGTNDVRASGLHYVRHSATTAGAHGSHTLFANTVGFEAAWPETNMTRLEPGNDRAERLATPAAHDTYQKTHGWGTDIAQPQIFVPVQPMVQHSALGKDLSSNYIAALQGGSDDISAYNYPPSMLMPPPFSEHMSSKVSHLSAEYMNPDHFTYGKSSPTLAGKGGMYTRVQMPVSPRNFDYEEDDDETNSEASAVMAPAKRHRAAEPVAAMEVYEPNTICTRPVAARIQLPRQLSPPKSPGNLAGERCLETLVIPQKRKSCSPAAWRKTSAPRWVDKTQAVTFSTEQSALAHVSPAVKACDADVEVQDNEAEAQESNDKAEGSNDKAEGSNDKAEGSNDKAEDNDADEEKPLVDWRALDLPESVWLEALKLYDQVKLLKAVQNRQPIRMKHAILAALVVSLCRTNCYPRTIAQICTASNTTKHEIHQYLRLMKQVLGKQYASSQPVTPSAFLHRWCSVLELPLWVADAATKVHDRADKMAIVQGKTPPGIYAASIWLVVWCYNHRHALSAIGFTLPSNTTVTSACVPNVPSLKKSDPMLECSPQHVSDKGSIGIPTITSVFKRFVPNLKALVDGLLDAHL
ncbi:hypothetical protein GGH12_001325 [Coemansia sp. RSA 1822]|nr:hypothetical protein LPJ76_003261 [Coemansia sp. RSA 638]KAJ2541311.1 hypothetical protein GGF49_003769 [Coemansia sp. RSA 1853]KAJ2565530.1 hypothetical protein GGH12_001325 [Coemansia sp. RSA 1822]